MAGTGVGRGVTIRPLAVAVIAALLALQVVRSALVALPYSARPSLAATLWPSHPSLLIGQAMAEIGTAAAKGQRVPDPTLDKVAAFARKSPLAPEPFLIAGAIAQTEGKAAASEPLFLAARARDPRSRAARFFLADRFLRTGRIAEGLVETAALARIEPRAAAPLAPSLAAYASAPGAVPELRRFFRLMPHVEPGVLAILADDARNADLVLALATRSDRNSKGWQERIVNRLIEAGQYDKARSTWTRLTGAELRPGLFNPTFEDRPEPPPFNWTLPETSDGVAEGEQGRLNVLYYGGRPATLASQLLLLGPGRYRLAMEATGEMNAARLQWVVRCANPGVQILVLPIRGPAPAGSFTVPSQCPAQWLELRGEPGDVRRTSEISIARLRLAAEPAS